MKTYKQKASGRIKKVEEGFNFGAFLLGPLWYIFEGMVGRGILIFIGSLIVLGFFNLIGIIIVWLIIGVTANKTHEDYLISKGYTLKKPKKRVKKKTI